MRVDIPEIKVAFFCATFSETSWLVVGCTVVVSTMILRSIFPAARISSTMTLRAASSLV